MPFTDREKFLYMAMSFNFSPVIKTLDQKTKDDILTKMRDQLAPNCTDKDYNDILRSSRDFQFSCGSLLTQLISKGDFNKVAKYILSEIGLEDIEKISEKYHNKQDEIRKLAKDKLNL